jgi:5-oxoprolinase (ATP-hydrolysing)
VRAVVKKIKMEPGDVIITNHPHYGGSHLPDVTLISPVFDDESMLVGYVANRAHHAELGGITPGSFPAHAVNLQEEGVIIPPTYLVRKGEAQWKTVRKILTTGPWPTRAPDENMADLNGALASIYTGNDGLQALCRNNGTGKVEIYMEKLQSYSAVCLTDTFGVMEENAWFAEEKMDDGYVIRVKINQTGKRIRFDFTGTSPVHPGNLNATFAILNSAVIYVLRLMIDQDIPLNEGIMRNVEIITPVNFLNPDFPDNPQKCPAVVGGNTETSQRVVDTLIKALGLAACSQGTMNNLIFGNEGFGFYETIGGGTGAGPGFDGADAVHQHMTNTRITDPEIMEFRYPVKVIQMAVRKGSGGTGKRHGGDGIVREILFEEPVTLNLLGQHRKIPPYGLAGGGAGRVAEQYIVRKNGKREKLVGNDEVHLQPGDRIVIKTPGGGGYGRT